MTAIPQEAWKFKPATREKVRRGLASLLERALREDKSLVSVAKLRDEIGGDQNAITTLLRLWRASELTVAEPWDDAPAPAADGDDNPAIALAARIREARS